MMITVPDLLTGLPIAGVDFALRNANPSGKIIVAVLLLGSVLAWSLMIVKFRELFDARKFSDRFRAAYRKESSPVGLHLKRQSQSGCPLQAVYAAVCSELTILLEARGLDPDDLFLGREAEESLTLSAAHVAAVRNASERTVADQIMLMENGMGMLATAVTTAPFLGLLGTVWGVMEAFGGMASKGTAMLSAVAPGISGALLTTVVGLLVALPSAIGYNLLSDSIRRLSVRMDNFAQEVVADIERFYAM
jgi:biopolymer transport protein TolQ